MTQVPFHLQAIDAAIWDALYVDLHVAFEQKLRLLGARVRGLSWFCSRSKDFQELGS